MSAETNEFNRLLGAAGWSQAEAARRLHVTPGAVSQLCSGKTRPRAGTLNLLRLLIERTNPRALVLHERALGLALEPWERELIESLRRLPPASRARLLAAFREMMKVVKGRVSRG